MKEIRRFYMMVYGNDLIQDIRKNCSGDYEKAMVALVAPRARETNTRYTKVYTLVSKRGVRRNSSGDCEKAMVALTAPGDAPRRAPPRYTTKGYKHK
eukprot:2078836-Pyramimonas_sp.AAC.1